MSVLTAEVSVVTEKPSRVVACGVPSMAVKDHEMTKLLDEMLASLESGQPSQTVFHEIREKVKKARQLAVEPDFDTAGVAQTVRNLADVEREHILAALNSQAWSRSKTAKLLGIDVKTLYNKIKRYEAGGFVRPDQN